VTSANAVAADDDNDDNSDDYVAVLSSVITKDVTLVSSMSVDWLSRKLYWIDTGKVSENTKLIFWVFEMSSKMNTCTSSKLLTGIITSNTRMSVQTCDCVLIASALS